MLSYIFGCNNVSIKVETNSRRLLSDLYSLYGEYYCDQTSPSFTIKYIEGPITEEVIDNYQIADREDENETYNYINFKKDVLSVHFDHYDISKVQFMQRIMINTFITELQRKGYVIVHGACVAKDGQCYIISGNKGAGKTTTMLKLLEHGYDFISNDKVAIKKINGEIIACGIPHSMGIIAKDVQKYHIEPRYGRYEGPKVYFRVSELSKALDVSVYNKSVLKGIIFPKYQPGTQDIESSLCEDNLNQFGPDNIFEEDAVADQKSYLLDILQPIEYANPSVVNEVPGYNVIQGEETFEQLSNFIQNKKPSRILR